MSDKAQVVHFKNKKYRYNEELLFHPPLHTQEEIDCLITVLKEKKITSVVEFGSGNGRLTFPLLMNGLRVTAVDISKESLMVLSTRAKANRLKMLSVTQHLPVTKSDAFVGCDILHHVNLDIYLPQMKKRLKKGGVLLFSEPNILNVAWIVLITATLDWRIEWRVVYCNYFTLMNKLKALGFGSFEIKGHGLLPPPLFNSFPILQKINYFLGDVPLLKLFAYRYIITAF